MPIIGLPTQNAGPRQNGPSRLAAGMPPSFGGRHIGTRICHCRMTHQERPVIRPISWRHQAAESPKRPGIRVNQAVGERSKITIHSPLWPLCLCGKGQTQNHVKNAHFPSGTHQNAPQIFRHPASGPRYPASVPSGADHRPSRWQKSLQNAPKMPIIQASPAKSMHFFMRHSPSDIALSR